MAGKRVFILAGYQHFAACHLLYHIGRVLEEAFGYEPLVVQLADESPANSPFRYPKIYPTIAMNDLGSTVRANDIFLPLAAASDMSFGLTLSCRKLLYVQGANTFRVLDGFMDGYVSVSAFVQKVLRDFYEIGSPVIHPFIELAEIPHGPPWRERKPESVVLFAKAPPSVDVLVGEFLRRLTAMYPHIHPRIQVVQRGVRHSDLMAALAQTRYFVALSPLEGFGLLPLEAMAAGCAVVGFHGSGGLEYMNARNSRHVAYPRLDALVDDFAKVFQDPNLAEALAANGRLDAQRFTRERFDVAWKAYLQAFGS